MIDFTYEFIYLFEFLLQLQYFTLWMRKGNITEGRISNNRIEFAAFCPPLLHTVTVVIVSYTFWNLLLVILLSLCNLRLNLSNFLTQLLSRTVCLVWSAEHSGASQRWFPDRFTR
jgi:hypothetical protein